ncbi:tetratricopeptide repeat protein [Colwellia echini]|uniref:Tetratricopeptide repeat protein n=1 Tax=Colwellia echini TaxID=1982103 RepID=A0ABY3MUG8_9GAMM|nr:tetratricopeptide repeat protein [Colwellia echini]
MSTNTNVNTKIYKHVHSLAKDLMQAVMRKNQAKFDEYYAELQQVCDDNEDSDKDHPVQWETLADFTDDLELAITIYEKALVKAQAINSKDFLSSISFAIASLQVELGDTTSAIAHLEQAMISSNKIADKDLKAEIQELLAELKGVEVEDLTKEVVAEVVIETVEEAPIEAQPVEKVKKLKTWQDL